VRHPATASAHDDIAAAAAGAIAAVKQAAAVPEVPIVMPIIITRGGVVSDPTDAGLTTTQKFYKHFGETYDPWRPNW
jgi:hypothetical protein